MLKIEPRLSQKIANTSFVCACLVVIIHSPISKSHYTIVEWFFKALTQVAVPVFFVISGFMLARHCKEDGWYKREIYKRIRTLVIPFFSLNILWFPLIYIIHAVGVKYFGADSTSEVMKLTWNNFLSGIGVIPWKASCVIGLWFIKALMLLVILSPIFYFGISHRIEHATVFMFILFLLYIFQMLVRNTLGIMGGVTTEYNVWIYELNMRCPLYFTLGMVLWLYAPEKIPNYIHYLTIVLGIVALVCYRLIEFNSTFIQIIVSCLETILISIALWNIIPSQKWPKWLTSNSFAIFVLHGAIIYLLPIPFKALHIWTKLVNLLGPIPIALVTITIALALAQFIKHYTPFMAKVLFGGR